MQGEILGGVEETKEGTNGPVAKGGEERAAVAGGQGHVLMTKGGAWDEPDGTWEEEEEEEENEEGEEEMDAYYASPEEEAEEGSWDRESNE